MWNPFRQRFLRKSKRVAPQVVLHGLKDFTLTREILPTSPGLESDSISSTSNSLLLDLVFGDSMLTEQQIGIALLFPNFTRDLSNQLRTL